MPRARGPHSLRPWNQPTIAPARQRGGRLASAAPVRPSQRRTRIAADAGSAASGSRAAARAARRTIALRRRTPAPSRRAPSRTPAAVPARWCHTYCAAPSAVPASPAAGWTKTSLKPVSREDLAVGDRVQRAAAGQAQRRQPGPPLQPAQRGGRRPPRRRPAARRARSWSPLGRARRPGARAGPNSLVEALATRAGPSDGLAVVPGHGHALARRGGRSRGRSRSGRRRARRTIWRSCGQERGPAVGGQAHHLVLVAVLREAEELRDRRVEDAERVREHHLVQRPRGACRGPPRSCDDTKSPKPSTVRQAASSKGEQKKAEARWARWCSTLWTVPAKRPPRGRAARERPRSATWRMVLQAGREIAARPGRRRKAKQHLVQQVRARVARDRDVRDVRQVGTRLLPARRAMARAGKPAQCLMRLSRSSSTPARSAPSRSRTAAESPWKALMPRTSIRQEATALAVQPVAEDRQRPQPGPRQAARLEAARRARRVSTAGRVPVPSRAARPSATNGRSGPRIQRSMGRTKPRLPPSRSRRRQESRRRPASAGPCSLASGRRAAAWLRRQDSHQLVVEERHAQLQRVGHGHGVGVAQQRAAHVPAELQER